MQKIEEAGLGLRGAGLDERVAIQKGGKGDQSGILNQNWLSGSDRSLPVLLTITAAPLSDITMTKSIAHTGEMTHSIPTEALETKSPTPLTVARTPKPTPRMVAGSSVAAVVFSSVSQTPM